MVVYMAQKCKLALLLLLLSSCVFNIVSSVTSNDDDDPYASCAIEGAEKTDDWIKNGGIILIIIGLIQCFWGLSRVCDHYFCQSMKVLCENYQISENLAGATFMAIGSSAGDLFISIFALFIQKSTVGMGTIIGSEIFNHLVISAACVLNSKERQIKLEKTVLTRECIAYAITLFVLMCVLSGGSFKRSEFSHCLTVQWWHGFILMMFYVVYAVVAVKFDSICTYLGYKADPDASPLKAHIAVERLERIKSSTGTGLSSAEKKASLTGVSLELGSIGSQNNSSNDKKETNTQYEASKYTFNPMKANNTGKKANEPDPNDGAYNLMPDYGTDAPIIADIADIKRELKLIKKGDTNKDPETRAEYVANKTAWAKFVHYFTLPLKTMISYTIPDLHDTKNRKWFVYVMVMSCVWMGLLAELLLMCIDVIGNLLGVSSFIMGVSLAAMGASMPTLWSSIVVARDGFGDMAISNALGANIFSVLFGLGFPWFAYPLYIKGGYDGIMDGGIIPLLFTLLGILIIYYLMIMYNDWTISYWMGWFFLVSYVCIITMCCTIFNTQFKM